jgi:TolB-like protein
VHCAMEIAKALKNYPHVRLRMGVHSGPVDQVTDVNDQTSVAGVGINVAERVMDCGDAGHILISKRVADDLAQDRLWQPLLHELGEIEVKHGVKLGIVNLYTEELGNPHPPTKLTQHPAQAMQPVGSAKLETGPRVPEKSIAVLPFENLSADPENAFFADGVQDEILMNLAKIADLKVTSRSSVMQYRVPTRNLRDIATALGVAHILEGNVQRAGNRVRVSAQLIDARTDTHLWAENYHRPLDDVFAIQSEIAKAVADQLEAKLSPAEKSAIEQPPTADLVAYDRYLRGKKASAQTTYDARMIEHIRQAIRLLDQAVAHDPGFYLAWCQLARMHDQLYFFGGDHSPARIALARQALNKALVLAPERAEAQPAREVIQELVREDPSVVDAIAEQWFYVALCRRDATEIGRALASITAEGIVPINVRMPRTFCEGVAARALGNESAAEAAFTSTRAEMTKLVDEQPDYAEALSVLAMSEAALGNKANALQYGRRAAELFPITKDAITGGEILRNLAITYAWAGEKDLALTQLEEVVRNPCPISYGQLRLHPWWDSLRDDPRFEKLVEEAKKPVALK